MSSFIPLQSGIFTAFLVDQKAVIYIFFNKTSLNKSFSTRRKHLFTSLLNNNKKIELY